MSASLREGHARVSGVWHSTHNRGDVHVRCRKEAWVRNRFRAFTSAVLKRVSVGVDMVRVELNHTV